MGVPFTAIWVNHGYTAKREMSEEKRVSPMIFLTWNALGARGVETGSEQGRSPFGPGLEYDQEHLAFSHGLSFLKAIRGNKQVNKYITTSLYT